MKKIILILVIFLLSIAIVFAQESHDTEIEKGKKLVNSKISCDKLSNEQLESIVDYYMEQMHPGEAHEMMDNMMGGEGSESLRQVHINMARRLYCDENVYTGYGMMGGGMMGSGGYGFGYWSFINILYIILLIGLIILVYLWILKLLKDVRKGNRKNEH